MRLFLKRYLLLSLLILAGCGSFGSKETFQIAMDPSFFPLNLHGQGPNIYAFSNELLLEISEKEGVEFATKKVSWDILELGLKNKKYDGIFSSMPLYLFHEKKYDASPVFLQTGPVLVASTHLHANGLDDLDGKAMGIIESSDTTYLLETHPSILIRSYTSAPEALNAITRGEIEGALIPYLLAKGYIADLYSDTITIIGKPLTDEGIRLITLYKENNELLKAFNKGLKKLQDSDKYDDLLQKWNLSRS